MADHETWLERRRRMVKCKAHGLHFDPKLTSGCPLCRRSGVLELRRQGPRFLVTLLAVLGMALVTAHVYTTLDEKLPGFGDSLGARPATAALPEALVPDVKLAPEPFRAQLETLEETLFDAPGSGFAELASRVLGAVGVLSGAVKNAAGDDLHRTTATAIAALADTVDPASFNVRGLDALRSRWVDTRGRHFRPAPWLRGPVDVVPGAKDPAAILAYQTVAASLVALTQEGAAQIGALHPAVQLDKRQASWRAWVGDWGRRIDEAERGLPPRPGPSAPAELLIPVQNLDEALSQLRQLAADPDLPAAGDPQQRFDEVRRLAQQAQLAFGELLVS